MKKAKEVKSSSTSASVSNNKFLVKLSVLGAIIFLFWVFLSKGSIGLQNNQPPKITQVTAQLSAGKNGEWGTAAKTTNGIDFEVNVTAFLPKPAKGLDYYVYLKGNGAELKDLLLGKMILSGDVYSLNFKSDMDYFGYQEIVVVKETEAQSKEGKMTTVVLGGKFTN